MPFLIDRELVAVIEEWIFFRFDLSNYKIDERQEIYLRRSGLLQFLDWLLIDLLYADWDPYFN